MDADLSHDPAVLPALIAIAEHGADLAIGSRYVPGGLTENWPRRRRMLSRWGNRYAAGVLGLAVNDATAGYRAYRSDALERMEFETVAAEGYGFQVEMTYRLVRIGGKVVEFPITFRDRTEGSSKMSGGIVREALMIVIKLWVADFGGRRRRRAQGLADMRNWVVGGALIPRVGGVDLDGLVLVGNRRRDRTLEWTPPGGVIDRGESIRQGLEREVFEETGLTVAGVGRPALLGGRRGSAVGLAVARRGVGGRRRNRRHRVGRSRWHRRGGTPGHQLPRRWRCWRPARSGFTCRSAIG